MPPATASVTPADFAILAKRAGLTLSEAQHATLYEVYGHFEGMLARLRTTADRPRGAEPAHIFIPGQS